MKNSSIQQKMYETYKLYQSKFLFRVRFSINLSSTKIEKRRIQNSSMNLEFIKKYTFDNRNRSTIFMFLVGWNKEKEELESFNFITPFSKCLYLHFCYFMNRTILYIYYYCSKKLLTCRKRVW